MKYAEAIEELFLLQSRGIRLGVSRMHEALRFRGRPDRGLSFVHVTGSNGKGSTATMLASCLREAGYRTGLFTSPHLHRWVERVRIDGRPISEREAAARISDLLAAFTSPLAPETTFFELTTLCAIEAFRDHGCDVCVMEIGLGGRLDATNATGSELSVVTRVALDHTRILGRTLAAIAREKAGIFRPGVPVVSGARAPEARRVIEEHARSVRAPAWLVERGFTVEQLEGGVCVRAGKRELGGLRVGLGGAYQLDNVGCAVAALWRLRDRGWRVPDAAIRRGLLRARWPGRLERIAGRPPILLDCAHNPDGARALVRHLGTLRHGGRTVLVFGAMQDKEYRTMLRVLAPHVDRVLYPPPRMERGTRPEVLRRALAGSSARSMKEALARARRLAGRGGLVVVTGSIFVVAEARALLLGERTDPFIRM